MHYRRLGHSGLEVSEIGHGLWGMGSWTGSDDRESRRALDLSLELGCNFFDSAWAYGDGHSDHLLGALIRDNPGRGIIAASKVPPLNGKWPASPHDRLADTFPRRHVIDFAERIRDTLGVDAIDLLQFHVWDESWTAEGEWRDTVAELKQRGLIRWFGLSLNRWEPWNGVQAVATGAVDVVQVVYNAFDQSPEDQLFPVCRAHDVGVIARVPLDEGSLTGTLTKHTTFPAGDWRARYFGPESLGATLDRVERLKPLVPAGMSLAALALKFILACPDVSTTIAGMRRERHVRENTGASDGVPLAPELPSRAPFTSLGSQTQSRPVAPRCGAKPALRAPRRRGGGEGVRIPRPHVVARLAIGEPAARIEDDAIDVPRAEVQIGGEGPAAAEPHVHRVRHDRRHAVHHHGVGHGPDRGGRLARISPSARQATASGRPGAPRPRCVGRWWSRSRSSRPPTRW